MTCGSSIDKVETMKLTWRTCKLLALLTLAFFFFCVIIYCLQFPDFQQWILIFIGVSAILVTLYQLYLRFSSESNTVWKSSESSEFERFLNELTHCVYRLSERRIGALVVLENENPLDEFANKAVLLNAQFSPELFEAIFEATSPLCDGAVIIQKTTIVSAATILPLTLDQIQRVETPMGTRHIAGIVLSQISDAIIIVVSQETGKVSIAREGIMVRGVKMDRFKGLISSVFF